MDAVVSMKTKVTQQVFVYRTEKNTRTFHLPTVSPAGRLQLSALIQLCLHPQGPNTGSSLPHQLDLLLLAYLLDLLVQPVSLSYVPINHSLSDISDYHAFTFTLLFNKNSNLTRSFPAFSPKQGREKTEWTSTASPPIAKIILDLQSYQGSSFMDLFFLQSTKQTGFSFGYRTHTLFQSPVFNPPQHRTFSHQTGKCFHGHQCT